MQWLTALLAFSVTMLVFAIITSTLVESVHRIWGMRSAGLQLMLENIYDKVVKPHIANPPLSAAEFAAIIMENRAMAERPGRAKGWLRRTLGPWLHWMLDKENISDMPVEIFTQKLADHRIVQQADNFTAEVLADIGQKYEAFGREASIYFERRARLLSVLAAIPVAFLFFVHPYKIASVYVKNPEIAQAMANQAERVSDDYEALRARLDAAQERAPGSVTKEAFKQSLDDLKAAMEAARARSAELAAAGVPVGWPGGDAVLAPCAARAIPPDAVQDVCVFTIRGRVFRRPTLASAFWLLVGGLLIGLGAPFWARAVSSLVSARGVSDRIAEIVGGAGRAPAMRGGAGVAAPAPASVAERTFWMARETAVGRQNAAAERHRASGQALPPGPPPQPPQPPQPATRGRQPRTRRKRP
jgi:hypothetical protein